MKIVPHINGALLLISGLGLITITHFYLFTLQRKWLTEKLFVPLLYPGRGYLALSRRSYRPQARLLAFVTALACLAIIFKLAVTKRPLLMGDV